MAASGETVEAWGIDMTVFNAAFKRSVKSAAGGKQLTAAEEKIINLSGMKHMLTDAGYGDCMIRFDGYAKDLKLSKKVPYDHVITQAFFKKMTGGNEDKAKAMAKGVITKQEKLEKAEKDKQAKGGSKSTAAEATKRLTDTSKYTGSHQQRFGADGKGKGMDGRVDKADGTGYVSGYKNEGTYKK